MPDELHNLIRIHPLPDGSVRIDPNVPSGYEDVDDETLAMILYAQATFVRGINYERPHDAMLEAARRLDVR